MQETFFVDWENQKALDLYGYRQYIFIQEVFSMSRQVETIKDARVDMRIPQAQMALLEALNASAREPNERMKKAAKDYKKAIEEGELIVRH